MSLLDVTKEQIDSFLWANYRSMEQPEYFFGVDNNQDLESHFEKADFRVLFVFLSPGQIRAVSNTSGALYWIAKKTIGDCLFFDTCHIGEVKDREILKQGGIPFMFGNVSHRPATEYDLIMINCSIFPEVLNLPIMLANSGFDLTVEQRTKNDRLPPIILGGAGAGETSIILGHIYDGEKDLGKSLVDMCYYGYAEVCFGDLLKELYEYKKKHGSLCRNKADLYEHLINNRVCYERIFFPQFYEWHYADDHYTIKDIEVLDDRLPKRVKFNRITTNKFDGFPIKFINLAGESPHLSDAIISYGCTGSASACAFCTEGTIAGNYYERDLDDIEENFKLIRKSCAPSSISFFSFNLNYYSRFFDLLAKGSEYFSTISLHNERLDIIAEVPQQLEVARKMGINRLQGAVEGIGERIRNKILNKNLSRETLMKAFRNIFGLKLMYLKLGFILTGYETEEDFKDFMSEMDEMLAIRKEMSSNIQIQITITPLCVYNQISLRHLARLSSKMSFEKDRTAEPLIEYGHKHNIRIRFNGKGCGTWVEQQLLDLGPMGTDFLCKVTLEDGLWFRTIFTDTEKEIWLKRLAPLFTDPLWFINERPLGWIFPCDHIEYVTDATKRLWDERYKAQDYSSPMCLKTRANANPKCLGCQTCVGDHIKYMTGRELVDTSTVDTVIGKLADNRHIDTVRIICKTAPKWELYNRKSLSHYITSQLMKASPVIEDAFYEVGLNTTYFSSINGQKGWFGGTWAFDIYLRKRIPKAELKQAMQKINQTLVTAKVVDFFTEQKGMEIDYNIDVSYIGFTSELSYQFFKDKISQFEGNLKLAKRTRGATLYPEIVYRPDLLQRCLFVPYKGGVMVYMTLPAKFSPYLVLSTMLQKSYPTMLKEITFNSIDAIKEVENDCKCGRMHTGYSLITGKNHSSCMVCQGKVLLRHLLDKEN